MSETTADDLLSRCVDLAQPFMGRTGTPGVALGVVCDGQIATRALGVTSTDDPRPVTDQTLFRLCSVTKPFTATLAVTLDRAALVGLDDPVCDVLDVPLADAEARRRLTLRHLLQHVSGLEGEWPADLSVFGDDDEAVHRLVAEFGQLRQFAPVGRHWGYCNPGYWLASAVLSRAGGADFESLLTDRVLAPLGMADAGFFPGPLVHRVAAGHVLVGGEAVELPWSSFPRARNGSGGLLAGIDDLMRFAGLHLGVPGAARPPGLDDVALAEVARGTLPTGEPDEMQALGFQTIRHPRGELIKHTGGYPGYGARIVLLPGHGVGVAVLTNATGGGALGVQLEEWLADRLLGRTASVAPSFVEVPAARLARLCGSYVLPEVAPLSVEATDDGLRFRAEDRSCADADFDARPLSDTEFVISDGKDAGVLVEFLSDDDGRPTVLRHGGWLGGRVPAPAPMGTAGRHLERAPYLRALQSVPTPALVVSEAAVSENLDRVLEVIGSPDRWRPHLKTARTAWAARLLRARGVDRCKVSTLAELRMALGAGFEDVLLAYPAAGPQEWAVNDLATSRLEVRISVLADSLAALDTWQGRLSVFIDLDTGGHRTGVDVHEHALVVRIADELVARGHRLAGLHSYDGHLADQPVAVRTDEAMRSLRQLVALSRRLGEAGHVIEETVVGSSHTFEQHLLAAAEATGPPGLTVGPGTLVYADVQALDRFGSNDYVLAAGVLTRVVSVGAGTVTVDAGLTAVQVDAGRPHACVLGHDGLVAGAPSQEHLVLEGTVDRLVPVGSLLVLAPRHLDTSIAQFAETHVIAPDGSAHLEPISGRWQDARKPPP